MKNIILKKGREESLKRFHPWIFSGAVAKIEGEPYEGEVVQVLSSEGTFCAVGHFQKGSITVRVLSFEDRYMPDAEGHMPQEFWNEKLSAAMKMRRALAFDPLKTDCYRLVHGEGDSLPGLIVDCYGPVAVMQAHSAGMYVEAHSIAKAILHACAPVIKSVYNKSEGTAPYKAGLDLHDGYICGDDSVRETSVVENGQRFSVNWVEGQKTGFFLDQRDNRDLVGYFAPGRKVLNLFCYTGGFSIYALAKGAASVVSVDSSSKAVDMLRKNVALNFGSEDASGRHEAVCADAIDYLKNVPQGEYDLMVVDPPAFAKHLGALNNALRAYRRLNASAIAKVAPGGFVFTYSCSQVVDRNAFELAVFSAAASVGRSVRILRRLTQPADHPVNIYHPEGNYLKGLLLYVE